jgi:hypothetical protein
MVIYVNYCDFVVNKEIYKFRKGGVFRWLVEAFFLRNCVAVFVSNLLLSTTQGGEAFQKSKGSCATMAA